VSHLDYVSEDELNRLLSMVVDVENLFTCVHKEEDVDTKQVYFYLFRVSKKCFVFIDITFKLCTKAAYIGLQKSECS